VLHAQHRLARLRELLYELSAESPAAVRRRDREPRQMTAPGAQVVLPESAQLTAQLSPLGNQLIISSRWAGVAGASFKTR